MTGCLPWDVMLMRRHLMPDKKEEKKPIRKGYQGKTIPELSQDELNSSP